MAACRTRCRLPTAASSTRPPQVWYEWAVTQPLVSSIHNPGGRSYFVGL